LTIENDVTPQYAKLHLLIMPCFGHDKAGLESHTIKHNIDLLSRHSLEGVKGKSSSSIFV